MLRFYRVEMAEMEADGAGMQLATGKEKARVHLCARALFL
jgi:hypothetical protein